MQQFNIWNSSAERLLKHEKAARFAELSIVNAAPVTAARLAAPLFLCVQLLGCRTTAVTRQQGRTRMLAGWSTALMWRPASMQVRHLSLPWQYDPPCACMPVCSLTSAAISSSRILIHCPWAGWHACPPVHCHLRKQQHGPWDADHCAGSREPRHAQARRKHIEHITPDMCLLGGRQSLQVGTHCAIIG